MSALIPPPEAVCRYCFEGIADGELLSPCACKGNQQWVHAVCLIKWQRRQGRGTTSCEVCKTEWTVMLDALDREIFVRSVRTNPRYSEVLGTDSGGFSSADQERLLSLMTPGMLIVQTPEKAHEHGVVTLATLQQQQALQAAHRAGGGGFGSSASNLSLFANLLTLQRARHWLRGCYLIVARGNGDATDGPSGGDSIVAVNLARLASPEDIEAPGGPHRDSQAELSPLLSALGLDTPDGTADAPLHVTRPSARTLTKFGCCSMYAVAESRSECVVSIFC